MFVAATDRTYFREVIERMRATGCAPVALYGAGRVAHDLCSGGGTGDVVAVIDDDPGKQGGELGGLPIVSPEGAMAMGVRAVVIAAEPPAQDRLWARRRVFLERGVRVLCVPRRFQSKTWDDCFADHYDYTLGVAHGLEPSYERDYPAPGTAEAPRLLDPLVERMRAGASVCEIGPGDGRWTRHLIDGAGAYYAVDYSERLLFEVLEHRFAAHLDRLHLIHDETAGLAGVPDGSIDLVFSFDVFVHFKMDLVHQFLLAIGRVLAPGGRALIHFADWNAAAVEVWRTQHTAFHGGGSSLIRYAHPDWLACSARAAGLGFEVVGRTGQNLLCEFMRAG